MAVIMNSEDLRHYYIELNKLCASQDYEKALKTANKILDESPSESKAFHCKIVCLIQLEKFDDCLHQLNKKKITSLFFEKSYCEYRLNRISEALTTLKNLDDLDLRCLELKAQILYRQEAYDEAHKLYKRILKEADDDYVEERQTNFAAVTAALKTYGETALESTGLPEHTHELCYNSACFSVGKGAWVEAEEKLRRAEEICKETFADEEDVTAADELEKELAPIRVQLGYVLQRQGRHEEAMKCYQSVVKHKTGDTALMAVASNNIICLNKEQNVFDSKKRLKVATADNLRQKLNSAQRKRIALNQCLLYLYTNQSELCRRTAAALENTCTHSAKPALIYAAQLLREKRLSDAVAYLQEYCGRAKPTTGAAAVEARLALVQLFLQSGATWQACAELRQLPSELRHRPGVVSALVTLFRAQEDLESACELLDEALNATASEVVPAERHQLATRAVRLNLRADKPQRAAQLLEELRSAQPTDQRLLAQLIHAYSQFDTARAEMAARQLDTSYDVEALAQLDVDALETSFFSFGSRYKRTAQRHILNSPKSVGSSPNSEAAAASVAKKRVKKKKSKKAMPKNAQPGGVPDPERWLPRRERSYYRGKKRDKRRAQDNLRGPQGAVSSGNASTADLDMAAKSEAKARAAAAAAETNSPIATTATTTSAPIEPPRLNKPLGAKPKQKKRKGAKW